MEISTAYLETLKPMVSSMPCNIINAGGSACDSFLLSKQNFCFRFGKKSNKHFLAWIFRL